MRTIGFAVGMIFAMLVAVICCLILMKIMNNDNAVKTKYDERQKMVRGIGYKYSFWTLVVLLVIMIILDACELSLPIKNSVLYFLIIIIGIMVHTTYAVFHDGYFGINNQPKQYYVFFVLIGVFNVVIGVINSVKGDLIDDGKLDVPAINLLCGLMFVFLGICIVIKNRISKNEDDYEEDDEE